MIYDTHEKHERAGMLGHFADLELVVRDAVKALRPYVDKFDSVVVTGVSGCVVGGPVALALKKPLVVVRKENDGSHSEHRGLVVGHLDLGTRACFVDDMVCSGSTRRKVQEAIGLHSARLVLQYLYAHGSAYDLLYGPPQQLSTNFGESPTFR